MADFFEEEAEVSDEGSVRASSDEEEEEDEEDEETNIAGLINDDDDEEEAGNSDSDGGEIGRKKKRKHRDYDERLEDEDYDLIEENLGVKVERKKFRRVRQISDEEDSGSEDGGAGPSRELDDRDAIAKEIFAGEEEEEGELSPRAAEMQEELEDEVVQGEQFGALRESDEESDPDDFIVDDSGQPITKKKRKGHKHRYTDSALQEAQDIFGVDFEFEEFDRFDGEEYEDAEEEEYSEYEEDDEEDLDEDGEPRRRAKRPGKKRQPKKSIYDVFEPSELERGHFTDLDTEIKTADIPERFMLRTVPVTEADEQELEKESEWIYKHAFFTVSISNQEFGDQGEGAYSSASYERKPPRTKKKIKEALHFMRNQHFEVPFIAFYRKEYVEPELNFNDLYKVYHWDEKWCQLKARKANLLKLFEKMQTYQFDTVMKDRDFEAELPEDFRGLTNQDIEKLNAVDSTETLKDVYMHFLLYYGRELPKMHNTLNAKPKEKKMKVVTIKKKVMVKRWMKKKKEKMPVKERRIEDDDDSDGEGAKDSNKKEEGEEEEGKEKADEEKMDTEEKQDGKDTEKEKKGEEEDEGIEEGEAKDNEDEDDEVTGRREKEDKDKEDGEVGEEEEMEEVEVETDVEEEMEVEASDDEDVEDHGVTSYDIKQANRKSMYALCQDAKLTGLAAKFGLTPEQFGENLRDNYQRHDPEQHPASPKETALDYLGIKFKDVEGVLKAARYMVALQIAHDPLVRQCVRQTYYERAKISVRPTKKGIKEIDESHPVFGSKYLKNKQVKDLMGDQFLKLVQAEKDKLIEMTMSIDMVRGDSTQYTTGTFFDEMKQLYYIDEFSDKVQHWNKEREGAIEMALNNILYPQLAKELRIKLIEEAKEGIIKQCCMKMYNWLKVMPYQVDQPLEEDEDDWEGSSRLGLRAMGFAFSSSMDDSSFCCMLDGEGEVTDFLRLPHFLRRRNAYWQRDRDLKEADVEALKNFISQQKPHVIAIAAEGRNTTSVLQDVRACIEDLESEQQMAPIKVELIDSNVSFVYQATKMAESEFRDYPPLLRQAVSVARRLQDPLLEFSRLCNEDDDLLCLKLHPQQESVSTEDLKESLFQEFIYRVNEVGVDINRAITHPHTASLVQFVCGLGPRKGNALVRTLKQKNQRLDNRNQLVMQCQLGPKVFINCAGFLKIDTASAGDGADDTYIEVLDSTRIHPETYEWARKMAVDALEYDEANADDANPSEALEEILENPDKLKDLDLDAFAEELERQGYGNRSITLYDIRAELNSRYKDLRVPFHPPSPEETFSMLTKETPETFYRGKMVMCTVTGIARRRPTREMLDDANPSKNDETGLWLCPFCQQDNFCELNEVWSHFDTGNCPGQAVGVKTRLDNGITGFIHTKQLSDNKVKNPEDRVKVGMTLHARIIRIDIERFQVDLTSKSSDLQDRNGEWAPPRDTMYDYETAETDKDKEDEEKKKKAASSTYVKRVIAHPSFQNITYKQAEKVMRESDVGDTIIRPSSKGADHLTVTWKVEENIYQHIDVKEEGKDNDFSLGHSLRIGEEEFEDLDEIIARHIQPMAALVRDVTTHKYYKETDGGTKEIMDKFLTAEKKKAPNRIPYFMSFCRDYPGKFLLSYLPRNKVRHEYATVTPDGFRFRGQMFTTINSLHRWFKVHFRDPIPGMNVTPTPMSTHRTPMSVAHDGTPWQTGTPMIQRTGTTFTGGIYATPSVLQGTPRQTPGRHTPQTGASGRYGYGSYPYATPQNQITTPVGATPSYQRTPQAGAGRTPQVSRTPQINPSRTPRGSGMTPQGSATPQGSGTPQYTSQRTPRQSWGGGTPSQMGQRPVARTPQRSSGGGVGMPGPSGGVDWAQQAAQWAKRRQAMASPAVQPSPSLHEPSPMSISTPAPSLSGGGDSTPLIDEQ